MFRRRIRLAVLGVLFVTITCGGLLAEPVAVKVHKKLIGLQGTEQHGMVQVTGLANAIEFPAEDTVTVKIENRTTKDKVDATLNSDGSFTGIIPGEPSEKIRVYAINRDRKKRSYGTFLIPAILPDTPEHTPPTADVSKLIESSPTNGPNNTAPSDKQELAVIITVININTGEIISAERVAGPAKVKPNQGERLSSIAKRIISRCAKVIRSEFNRPNLRPVKPVSGENEKEEHDEEPSPVPGADASPLVESVDTAPSESGAATQP